MEETLKAELRERRGSGDAGRLRAAGRVPAVLYGHGMDPLAIHVSGLDLLHLFHRAGGSNVLVDLKVDGDSHLAIAREVQRDHIRNRFVHVDFMTVRRDEKIKVTVEVHEVGESVGVHEGGVIEHHLREVEVECLPGDVPERIEADITSLAIGDMLYVRDIRPPEGVTILTDPDAAVISVITPAALRVEADLSVPGEAPAEVEVAEEAPAEAPAEAASEAEPAPPAEDAGASAE
jgi:large subunit ribosomal protein L25